MTPDKDTLLDMQQSFGYTREDLKFFLDPMAEKGEDDRLYGPGYPAGFPLGQAADAL